MVIIKLKILKKGNTYGVKKVHDNCYQLVIVIKEFSTEEDARKALVDAITKEKI